MKFKGPENVTSISVGGECFNVGDDGLIETSDNGNYASLLAPHGFEPFLGEKKATAPAAGVEVPPVDSEVTTQTDETQPVVEAATETAPAAGVEKPAKKAK